MKIVVGSNSKWRKKILLDMGYIFDALNPEIDEKSIRYDDPEKLTLMLAHKKADVLLPSIIEDSILITFDVVGFSNGVILEKPRDAAEARAFLKSYEIHPVHAISAVVAHNTKTGERLFGVEKATVIFKKFPDSFIETLIDEGDIFSCAGAFRIFDPRFDEYIESLDGTKECVSGVPASLTRQFIDEFKK